MKFASIRKTYSSIPWIALTHNASSDVLNDIANNLEFRQPVAIFKKSSFRKNLYYDIIFKNTILDEFVHLAKYVNSCLNDDDDSTNNVRNFIYY